MNLSQGLFYRSDQPDKKIAFGRGSVYSDVVMIRNFHCRQKLGMTAAGSGWMLRGLTFPIQKLIVQVRLLIKQKGI